MIDIAKTDERLSKTLSEKRYTHSVYVAHTASDLANIFGADVNKAFIAGLFMTVQSHCHSINLWQLQRNIITI